MVNTSQIIDIIDDPRKLPESIYNMFFHGWVTVYNEKPLHPKVVTLSSGEGTIKKIQVGDFLYLEQNPFKNSMYGKLAATGHRIMWVIYEPQENKGRPDESKETRFKKGQYLLKIMDERMERLV